MKAPNAWLFAAAILLIGILGWKVFELRHDIDELERQLATSNSSTAAGSTSAKPEPEPETTTPPDRARQLIAQGPWICYTPTNFVPGSGPPPADSSIREDLKLLHQTGFRGLITYGAEIEAITRIAAEQGFANILLGIWNPVSETELVSALAQAEANTSIKAIIVGNEGIMSGRYSADQVKAAIERVRSVNPDILVTTTETVDEFPKHPELIEASDFITANAHPFWHEQKEPVSAVDWTVKAFVDLQRLVGDKPILLKEVGLPTGGDPAVSEVAQKHYYESLIREKLPFAWFEAFDMPWKRHQPVEPHWGIFHHDRSPKPAVAILSSESAKP